MASHISAWAESRIEIIAMRATLFLALVLSLTCVGPALAWETYIGRNMSARIVDVPAGNILLVRGENDREVAIRFYGIGVPTLKQPLGNEAHALLKNILPPGAKVTLTTVNEDEEGIINALVQINDRSVNNRLVSEGLAWVDRSTCKAFFCRRWHIEEHLAQKERRGIWGLNFSTPPWQWGEIE